MERVYQVGVDVTIGTWVYVDAENEQDAKAKAKELAETKVNTSEPIIHTEVHCIYEDSDTVDGKGLVYDNDILYPYPKSFI